jgi:hypothetical protein
MKKNLGQKGWEIEMEQIPGSVTKPAVPKKSKTKIWRNIFDEWNPSESAPEESTSA